MIQKQNLYLIISGTNNHNFVYNVLKMSAKEMIYINRNYKQMCINQI